MEKNGSQYPKDATCPAFEQDGVRLTQRGGCAGRKDKLHNMPVLRPENCKSTLHPYMCLRMSCLVRPAPSTAWKSMPLYLI
ncbi:unnamed protein product [Pleuronectes platessa]|uniref:Uncharacterized protein n=1 Tax=Pleuronectes platessa TaxID=8262 RepID=A0A9N7YUX0_PLEPL|nr:unnamed protein product [Pleuronectes platessa]